MKRYIYSVSASDVTMDPSEEYSEDLLGEGSGPASHVAANLRRLADQIDPPAVSASITDRRGKRVTGNVFDAPLLVGNAVDVNYGLPPSAASLSNAAIAHRADIEAQRRADEGRAQQ